MQYIIDNKEWIFSGIGATILALIVTIFITNRNKKSKDSNSIKNNKFSLRESHSNNIQLINHQTNNDKRETDLLSQATIDALRELYKHVNSTLKSIEIGLAPLKINPSKDNTEYLYESIEVFNQFKDYFDSNEILFDSEIIDLVLKIKETVSNCLGQQRLVENYKSMNMPSDKFIPEAEKLQELYYSQIQGNLPKLKDDLKNEIQKRIKNIMS